MKPGIRRATIVGLALVAGLGAGAWSGFQFGHRVGVSTVATVAINTQVHHLENGVEALRALRDGDIDAGIDAIERRLDQTIISLLPEMREGIRIEDHTLSFVADGLRTAKRYRADHPRASQGTLVDNGIRRAFSTID